MFRTQKLLVLFLVVALALPLVPALAQEDECPLKVGLVTDVGRLNDQSFNESAWMGIQAAAEELGLGEECYDYVETQDTADYIPNIELLIEEGFSVIVTSGSLMTRATREAGLAYPDVFFIGTDQAQYNAEEEYDPIPNVAGLIYDESIAGFMAGALAGLMTESNVIAGVYGTDVVPAVSRFGWGYEEGAMYVNPDVEVLTAYHPGTPDVAFVDAQWGGETTQTMIDEGADVIFGAGGTTGNGALIAGCNALESGADVISVIGVDTDQYLSIPEVQPCIMSSAIKNLVGSTRDMIVAAAEGTFEGGAHIYEVGLAPFHEYEDIIPEEVKAELENIAEMIDAGEIETCIPPEEELDYVCKIEGIDETSGPPVIGGFEEAPEEAEATEEASE